MKKSETWGGPFQFRNPYDVVGAPQDASPEEIESIVEDVQNALRLRGANEDQRRRIDNAAALLLDASRREENDRREETRLLACQDPIRFAPLGDDEAASFVEGAFHGFGLKLRDYSDLPTTMIKQSDEDRDE